MRALEYSLRQGLMSVWRHRGSSLLAVVAIALALVVVGAVLLVTWNAQRWLASRAASAELSVYLEDGAPAEARAAIERALDASGVIASRTYVSKNAARTAFRAAVGDLTAIVDELALPFPLARVGLHAPERAARLDDRHGRGEDRAADERPRELREPLRRPCEKRDGDEDAQDDT